MFGEETRKHVGSGREWANGVREKMGWKIFGGRRVGSERREGIGWECSGRVETRKEQGDWARSSFGGRRVR